MMHSAGAKQRIDHVTSSMLFAIMQTRQFNKKDFQMVIFVIFH